MNIFENAENDVKKQGTAEKTGHVNAHIREASVSARDKVLNSFIHAWRHNQKQDEIQKRRMDKRFVMEGDDRQNTENPVFGKMSEFADEVMQKIKWNDDISALNQLHDIMRDFSTEIAGRVPVLQGIGKDEQYIENDENPDPFLLHMQDSLYEML